MLNERGRLLAAALGFAALPIPSYDRALHALHSWLDSWAGIRRVAVGMAPTHALRRAGMASHLLHEWDGTLTDERDGHCVGADALARNAAGAWEALRQVEEGTP